MPEIVLKPDKKFILKRKIRKMSTTQNIPNNLDKGQKTSGQSTASQSGKVLAFIKDKLIEIIVGVIVTGIAAWIGWTIHDLPNSVDELDKTVSNIDTKLEMLEGNYAVLNSQIWSINKTASDNQDSSADSELGSESGDIWEPYVLVASNELTAGMLETPLKEKNDILLVDGGTFFVDMEALQNETIIGVNLQNNENVTKESMENEPFIMQYEEKGEDVFFYGQYNEHGQWNGKCIINRYKDSKLNSIMEAIYKNGELESYQQIFKGINFQDQKIWYVSNRIVEGAQTSGETVTYFFYGDYEKKFRNEEIKKEDILSVSDFTETIPSTIEGYYNGYVSNGKYNDDSGNAYLIKYNPDGIVRYLYKGKIKDGYPHDSTGNAWSISWGYANDGYYYYKGVFRDGNHGKVSKKWEPMTQEEIKEKIDPNDFAYPLTGLIDDNG